jgi:hypothetical protein
MNDRERTLFKVHMSALGAAVEQLSRAERQLYDSTPLNVRG